MDREGKHALWRLSEQAYGGCAGSQRDIVPDGATDCSHGRPACSGDVADFQNRRETCCSAVFHYARGIGPQQKFLPETEEAIKRHKRYGQQGAEPYTGKHPAQDAHFRI